MGRGKKYQPEQVVNLLRQIEVGVANGKTTALACKETGVVEQSSFRGLKTALYFAACDIRVGFTPCPICDIPSSRIRA